MIHYTAESITALDRIARINLVNSVTGFKPANLVGTIDGQGRTNLAIISSVIHMGSDPGLIGFISRPHTVPRHTQENIIATECFTINHVHTAMFTQAHYTSIDVDRDVSEFEMVGLNAEYLFGFQAPYVAESRIKIGLTLADIIPIKVNNTQLIFGRVAHIVVDDANLIKANGGIDISTAGTVAISGLDVYHNVHAGVELPYAKLENMPKFR